MEHIDILDKDGNKKGITKTKSEIHKNGDWHRASLVWIINSRNELLIQRRSPAKDIEDFKEILDNWKLKFPQRLLII